MGRFVLVNRRAGLFTDATKQASRASVANALSAFGARATVLSDQDPADPLARRVVVIEADAAQVADLSPNLPPDTIIEPLVYHGLHGVRPAYLRHAAPFAAEAVSVVANKAKQEAKAGAKEAPDYRTKYVVGVSGGGRRLSDAQVSFYFSDAFRNTSTTTISADTVGRAGLMVPYGRQVTAVELIPYAGYWAMLAEAPASGTTIDCPPIANAGPAGNGWWHDVMGVDTSIKNRGAGIKVGVIDTGCGPHPNLAHVNLVGAFVDGDFQSGAAAAADVVGHGTHTTGIIGARPSKAGDYAGMAPDCTLFHVRVFKGEGPSDGPSNAALVKAIDALSRDLHCDLINISLGGGTPTQAEEDAIRDAAERGTLCVCSAGNSKGSIEYPAAYADCAAVSALGQLGRAPAGSLSGTSGPQAPEMLGTGNLFLANFSCYANAPGQALATCAPGVGVISAVPDKGGWKGLYMEMDGTSMASPAACGCLAVILGQSSFYKALPLDITRTNAARTALAQHCRSIGLPMAYQGHGLLRL